ncbi:hypothetical protein AAVH_08488 [Aphelenchoides avenae]|nr:hypothetical protein AAVH_08488 [Aphelenchus avenae]
MYALGLEKQDVFPGVFPVTTISTCTFKKVIEGCKAHKEPVMEEDPLTQECKRSIPTENDKNVVDAIVASIKDKHPAELCKLLQQYCDLDGDRIEEIYADNPLLWSVLPGARNVVTVFEKLPREDLDLERLQLVSTQFDDVIVSSSELASSKDLSVL